MTTVSPPGVGAHAPADDASVFLDPLGRKVVLSFGPSGLKSVHVHGAGEPRRITDATALLVVFGDLHGRIPEALAYVESLRQRSGRSVAAILQVGDLGTFDELTVIDRTTLRMARTDPALLGFGELRQWEPGRVDELLAGGQSSLTRLYFVEGNHDDLSYLRDRLFLDSIGQSFVSVDSGDCVTIELGSADLRVGGLGWSCQRGDVRRLANAQPDVVLAHTREHAELMWDYVSDEFPLTFFGHVPRAFDLSDPTRRVFGLEHLLRSPNGTATPGCAGLVIVDHAGVDFTYLPESFEV